MSSSGTDNLGVANFIPALLKVLGGFLPAILGALLIILFTNYSQPMEHRFEGVDQEYIEAKTIEIAFDNLTEDAIPLVTALAGVGILTMAVLQMLKDVLPLRRWFQYLFLLHWVWRKIADLELKAKETRWDMSKSVINEMANLATAGDKRALFDLPAEKLTGQLNAAAKMIIADPEDRDVLLKILTNDAKLDNTLDRLKSIPRSDSAKQAKTDVQNRVTQKIQRALDGIQISMRSQWKRFLKIASYVVSGTIIYVVPKFISPDAALDSQTWPIMAAVGGMLAPVARDLLVSLQKLRSRVS